MTPTSTWAALDSHGHVRRYRRGETLFREGDHSDFVALVLAGQVKLVVASTDGKESILCVRGPGELVGELAALDAAPRMATAIAVDALTARIVSAADFTAELSVRPGAALALTRLLVDRLREADRRRVEFGTMSTTPRVARVLRDLCAGAPAPVELTISQQELAALAGASRESAVRALSRLRTQGVISTARARITVLDPVGLGTACG